MLLLQLQLQQQSILPLHQQIPPWLKAKTKQMSETAPNIKVKYCAFTPCSFSLFPTQALAGSRYSRSRRCKHRAPTYVPSRDPRPRHVASVPFSALIPKSLQSARDVSRYACQISMMPGHRKSHPLPPQEPALLRRPCGGGALMPGCHVPCNDVIMPAMNVGYQGSRCECDCTVSHLIWQMGNSAKCTASSPCTLHRGFAFPHPCSPVPSPATAPVASPALEGFALQQPFAGTGAT